MTRWKPELVFAFLMGIFGSAFGIFLALLMHAAAHKLGWFL